MLIDKAIAWLEKQKNLPKTPSVQKEEDQIIEFILEVCEKTKTRKPETVSIQPYFRKHYINKYVCPACKKAISMKYKYCPSCSQAIDWSDV